MERRPPYADQCDGLIRRAGDIAGLVRGTAAGVQLRNCMQWRSDIYGIMTHDPHAAPYIYVELMNFFKRDIRHNFVEKGKTARDLFQFVTSFFKDFKAIAKAIVFAFAYLDQYFTKRADKDPLTVMIFKIFKVSGYDVIKGELVSTIMTRMNSWRDGEEQNLDQLKISIDFFLTIGAACAPPRPAAAVATSRPSVFEEDFLRPCISQSRTYYDKAAAQRRASLHQTGTLAYFDWARAQLAREERLAASLGLEASWVAIKAGLVGTLITAVFDGMVRPREGGLAALLDEGRDVSTVYAAAGLIPDNVGVATIAELYASFIAAAVGRLFDAPSDAAERPEQAEQQKMKQVIDLLRSQRLEIIPQQFSNDPRILSGWDSGVHAAFRKNPNVPRLLVEHMDAFLSGAGAGGDDEEAVGAALEFYKCVFMCVVQKDEFFVVYKGALARRLLRGQFRRTAEAQMLSRLKLVSGNAEVYPLNAMVADMDNSDRLSSDMLGGASMADFAARERLRLRTVLVTAQYWPTFAYMDMRPAPQMAGFIALFEAFYQSRFPNRRVRWVYQSSTGVVSARFAQGPKELSGTLVQASVLLLADGTAGLRIPQLVEATGLAKEAVADAVASMYMNKRVNVLECVEPATGAAVETKRITDALAFRLNVGFRCPVRKLDLPRPRAARAVDQGQIEALRGVLADVAIVRFMKSRGSASYGELLDAVLADLRRKFDAQPPIVKRQLEGLIDKGMVRRGAEDNSHLTYVA